jgi:hypothetical protein
MVVEAEITYATRSQSPVKRFFIICGNNSSGDTFDITLITDGIFPSRNAIADRFKDQTTYTLIGMVSIFEFNNESDYNQFIGE